MGADGFEYLPELKLLLGVVVVAVILGITAPWLIRLIVRLISSFSFLCSIFERLKSPVHLLIPLVGVQTLVRSAPDDLLYISLARHFTTLAIIAATTWLGVKIVKAGRDIFLQRHPILESAIGARRIQTQARVLLQILVFFIILFGIACMLMTFPSAHEYSVGILASAGFAGLAVGFAATPVLGNLIAGLQLAITQPISLGDVVIVENEWGRVEEITATYVVIKIWDDRRLIVPLQYFIERPFQNWTRTSTDIIGAVFLWVDYSLPLEPLRKELNEMCQQASQWWDGRVCLVQVTDATEQSMQLRVLVSSKDSSSNWDLRCFVREKLTYFISANYPKCFSAVHAEQFSLL
ncbi:MAG TPA: mechanosensitive ion channel domain-containing protein [Cellvibrionaceae bacterium]